MSNSFDAALVFGFLTFFHLWGGAAAGAGIAGRRLAPVLWGLLVGGVPLYFGIERGLALGEWGWLAWQLLALLISGWLVGARLPLVRERFLAPGMTTLAAGTFIMAAGALLGAWFFRLGSEFWSLLAGGLSFIFGAMWFGAGIKQLRGK
jgi:hypothetical protein